MITARASVPIVTAREYGPVDLPGGMDRMRLGRRLEAAGRRLGMRLFETRGTSLYATGVVGVVDVGSLILEVLPKTAGGDGASEGAAFLYDLRRFVGRIDAPRTAPASIAEAGGGFLELILDWAVCEAERNVALGLPRRYVEIAETALSIRGRVELASLARRRPGRGLEATVRHASLRSDNVISRTLRWLVREIGRRTFSLRTRARCARLERSLGDVALVTPRRDDMADLVLGPLEERWRPLLLLAATLLAQQEPDPARGGRLPAIAVLDQIHGLFEAAIRRVLVEGTGLVSNRSHQKLLLSDREDLFSVRPDYSLSRPGQTRAAIVGDAKWKRVVGTDGDINPRLDDVYQLVAYAASMTAEAAFIVSPLDDAGPHLIERRFAIAGLGIPIAIIGVHLPTLIGEDAGGETLRRDLCAIVSGMVAPVQGIPSQPR